MASNSDFVNKFHLCKVLPNKCSKAPQFWVSPTSMYAMGANPEIERSYNIPSDLTCGDCPHGQNVTSKSLPFNPQQNPKDKLSDVLIRLESDEPKFKVAIDNKAGAKKDLVGWCRLTSDARENFQAIDPTANDFSYCNYLVDDLKSLDQLATFQSKFGPTEYEKLMTVLAGRPSKQCFKGTACSQLTSNTDVGIALRSWFATAPTSVTTAIVSNICNNNPTLRECNCTVN